MGQDSDVVECLARRAGRGARYNCGTMACAACQAFLFNYKSASERYAALVLKLETMAKADRFKDPIFMKLKNVAEGARIDCMQGKEALRVHKTDHSCP